MNICQYMHSLQDVHRLQISDGRAIPVMPVMPVLHLTLPDDWRSALPALLSTAHQSFRFIAKPFIYLS